MSDKPIEVDQGQCMGYALCVGIAPDHFQLDDSGIAEVIKDEVEPDDVSKVEEAAAVCPQMAIRLNLS